MRHIFYILMLVIVIYGCKQSYVPAAILATNNYLVVEGVIVTGADSTIIKLSRTVALDSKTSTKIETGAKVFVESFTGDVYSLTAGTNGTYYSPGLNLDNTKKYRLNITTKDNKQYLSDFVQAQITPPIDSISYKAVNNILTIYANAHSAGGAINYYRYEYQETWEFHAKYFSQYYASGKNIVLRPASAYVYFCWGNHPSNQIILGTTAGLTQGILSQLPLTYIKSSDERLSSRYSILVKQYALTKDAYNFWSEMKKNTENLGSIFDPSPSALQGNIHCITTPSEIVIGYIGASTIASQRIYILKSQIPQEWFQPYPYDCLLDTVYTDKFYYFTGTPALRVPIGAVTGGGAYSASSPECSDCSIRGSNKKPSYWPN